MEALIFEPSLWQNPPGSIRINLSWTGDEGTSPARLTAFPFLILSHAVVASSSSTPRPGANPIPCFFLLENKSHFSGDAVLAYAELMGEKLPLRAFLVYSGHSAEQSQHIDLSPTDYIQRHQSVWNVERENMLLFALYSMWLH